MKKQASATNLPLVGPKVNPDQALAIRRAYVAHYMYDLLSTKEIAKRLETDHGIIVDFRRVIEDRQHILREAQLAREACRDTWFAESEFRYEQLIEALLPLVRANNLQATDRYIIACHKLDELRGLGKQVNINVLQRAGLPELTQGQAVAELVDFLQSQKMGGSEDVFDLEKNGQGEAELAGLHGDDICEISEVLAPQGDIGPSEIGLRAQDHAPDAGDAPATL